MTASTSLTKDFLRFFGFVTENPFWVDFFPPTSSLKRRIRRKVGDGRLTAPTYAAFDNKFAQREVAPVDGRFGPLRTVELRAHRRSVGPSIGTS